MAESSDGPIRAKCFHPTGTFIEFSQNETEQSMPTRFEDIVARHCDMWPSSPATAS